MGERRIHFRKSFVRQQLQRLDVTARYFRGDLTKNDCPACVRVSLVDSFQNPRAISTRDPLAIKRWVIFISNDLVINRLIQPVQIQSESRDRKSTRLNSSH